MVRRGFSLVEILISTGIFALVSVGMISVYTIATDLVRLGESRRVAADEAVAALARLDRDLASIVPAENHGFFSCQAPAQVDTWYPGGSMAIAFMVGDPQGVSQRATNGTMPLEASTVRLVMWMVRKDGVLVRREEVVPATNRWSTVIQWFDDALTPSTKVQEIARGCLLLSVDLDPLPTSTSPTPDGNMVYCTEKDPALSDPVRPFPTTARLTVAFSGGDERSTRGRLIHVTGTQFRVTGVRALANEGLVRYERSTGQRGWITLRAEGGGLFQAQAKTEFREPALNAADLHRADIVIPSVYTVTRTLGR